MPLIHLLGLWLSARTGKAEAMEAYRVLNGRVIHFLIGDE